EVPRRTLQRHSEHARERAAGRSGACDRRAGGRVTLRPRGWPGLPGAMAVVLALFGGALAEPALAQEASATDDIVVTGKAAEPTRSEISRQARAITRPQNFHDLPLARFEDRLCPGVIGMKADYASMVI